jgi:glucose/arabinose dehydrogenase
MRFAAHVVLAAALVAPLPSAMAPAATRPVHERFETPVQVTNAGDGTDRLFVVERRGVIRATHEGGVSSTFLDLRASVQDGGERGLLGLAFHPRFRTNRHLFVFYTRDGGDIVVARYTADATRSRVDPATARPVLLIEHSERSNHNGGGLAFGPDGYLYVAVGDGGGAGDPEGDARSITRNFLGKILRIDIDRTGSGTYGRYGIPSSNPFAGATPGRGEIWAYGLRNPWRISFDRSSGALYIGDVGQGSREEIDRQSAGAAGGRDYGWNVMEGTTCYRPSACPLAGDTLPIAEYTHAGGNCSITGGYVYRGTAIPSLVGHYIFGDYCTGRIWSLRPGGRSADITLRRDTPYQITSFGEHEDGELSFVTIDGRLERFRLG